MKLTLKDLERVTLGVDRIEDLCGKIRFHRFTEQEELFYQTRDKMFARNFRYRCKATSGVRLSFLTNSKKMKIAALVSPATSRSYFSFDVFENGKPVGYLDNFKDEDMKGNFTEISLSHGNFEKTFSLTEGVSEVTVYFPWSVSVDGFELELDDEATVTPLSPSKKLLMYGDSITQGYDAIRPSNRYAALLADRLGAEEINKAIGGEVFVPELARMKVDFLPDYIAVAYGTNDWSTTDGSRFLDNAKVFLKTLSEYYPNARIFAITPIWRADFEEYRKFGDFCKVEKLICEAAAGLENVSVISGIDFVERDVKLFADLRLHPRDEGFVQYYENLSKKIGELI